MIQARKAAQEMQAQLGGGGGGGGAAGGGGQFTGGEVQDVRQALQVWDVTVSSYNPLFTLLIPIYPVRK